ncbi:AAA family ATPase [candidate division KSB1 bacterium]
MKIAVTGKGGVGKTTVCAGLSLAFAEDDHKVLSVDADPDSNLAATFGFPEPDKITPVSEMKELINERTGAMGGFFKMNPRVEDIPDKYCVEHKGVRLLVMGRIKEAGTGCYCPENAFAKALITHILIGRDDLLIMDMEAGIEHLGRGTSGNVDLMIVVVEPGKRSIETAFRIKKMADELKLKKVMVIGNKIRSEEDIVFIIKELKDLEILGFVWYNQELADKVDEKGLDVFNGLKEKIMQAIE